MEVNPEKNLRLLISERMDWWKMQTMEKYEKRHFVQRCGVEKRHVSAWQQRKLDSCTWAAPMSRNTLESSKQRVGRCVR